MRLRRLLNAFESLPEDFVDPLFCRLVKYVTTWFLLRRFRFSVVLLFGAIRLGSLKFVPRWPVHLLTELQRNEV